MSKAFAKISVIVPAYNPGDKLVYCLQSLIDMDYPPERLEITVVDDCSSYSIEDELRTKFPQVKFIRRKCNGGCDAARQDGIDAAEGEIIANTDSDCLVSPLWAHRINSNLSSGAAAVTGPVWHKPGLLSQLVAITQFGHSQSNSPGYTATFPGCNFAVRRSALSDLRCKVQGLRDGGDRILAWKLHASGKSVVYDPLMYVQHDPSLELRPFLRRWMYYAAVTGGTRKMEPGLPGGKLGFLGPAAPPLWSLVRMGRDYQRLVQLTACGRIMPHIALGLAAVFPLLRLLDAIAMLSPSLHSKVIEIPLCESER